MQNSTQTARSLEKNPFSWVLTALFLTTLYFQANLYDPFNSPKSWILLLVAGWLLGYIYRFKKILFIDTNLKVSYFLVILFIFALSVVTLFTDSKFIAVFGDTQRRNGYLSYISLSIIFIASIIFIRRFNVVRIFIITIWIGFILAIYALMQSTGNDFVEWNNPYNQIIGTLGNPNFAGAVMAIIGVILFSIVFINEFTLYYRVAAAIISLQLFYLIYQTNARQGLLSYIIGAGLFLIIFFIGKRKKFGYFLAMIGVSLSVLGVLGMLQVGPLEKYLYKSSVSVRGYYWRAGIEMFLDHPIIGIGMDRYGAYFKAYREAKYSITYGYSITSSNAHNTFIQFFATGGLLLGLSYLLLNVFILKCAISGLRIHSGNTRLLLAGVFAGWVAFHAQSLVSIDNVGISIWGWVLGASIIGISVSPSDNPISDKKNYMGSRIKIDLKRLAISTLATVVTFTIVSVVYRGEADAYKSRILLNSQDQKIRQAFYDLQLKVINNTFIDPTYKISSALSLAQNGFSAEALSALKEVYYSDPRSLEALRFLALTHESLNQISEAINYRIQIAKYDEWNAENYLELGKDYKKLGDLDNSNYMLLKILSFAPDDSIANQAKIDLGS